MGAEAIKELSAVEWTSFRRAPRKNEEPIRHFRSGSSSKRIKVLEAFRIERAQAGVEIST